MGEGKNLLYPENNLGRTSNSPIGVEDMDFKAGNGCSEANCRTKPVVIGLAGQNFCLEHFFEKCYERLDAFEPMVRSRPLDAAAAQAARAFLEDCSDRALTICFRHPTLTNSDRSKLLDILLLCGDLRLQVRKPPLDFIGLAQQVSEAIFSINARQKKNEGQA